jgi:two-component sensor histidine kinase
LSFRFLIFLLCFYGYSQSQVDSKKQLLIDSLVRVVDTYDDSYQKIKVLTSNAGRMRYTPETRLLINKAISISLTENKNKLLANSYYSLGNYFFFNSQLDSAKVYTDKSISYVDDKTMPFLRATNLMTQSGIFRKKGNISQAIASMLNAQVAIDKIDTISLDDEQKRKFKGESLVLNNSLANYYNQMEEFDKSSTYYDKAYKAALSLGSYVNAGIIISNHGELLLNQGKHIEALNLFKEGKALKEKGNAPMRFIMSSDLNIGNAQTKLNEFNDALENLNRAHEYYAENGPDENVVIAKNYRGNLYNAIGTYNEAIKDCEAAKALALEGGNLELIAEASECLADAYKAIGAYDKALENFKLLTKTNDSIFNENNIKKQTQQEMQYEFNKTQELNALELEAQEKQSKLYSYLAGSGLLLALVLGFFFYKNRKKNIQLAKQKVLLEATIDEKNVLLKETHHRVKNSFQIVSSLLYLQSESVEDKEAKIAIKEAENRVRSMVLIHQKLYNKDELVGINTKDYFSDLVRDIFESHQFKSDPIPYHLNVESHVLDIETITPIGLILNELIVNTLKHAFDEVSAESKIYIEFKKEGDDLVLNVIDNGKGFEGKIKSTSFGITLMKALSKKLKASLNYKSQPKKGTEATLVIKKYNLL